MDEPETDSEDEPPQLVIDETVREERTPSPTRNPLDDMELDVVNLSDTEMTETPELHPPPPGAEEDCDFIDNFRGIAKPEPRVPCASAPPLPRGATSAPASPLPRSTIGPIRILKVVGSMTAGGRPIAGSWPQMYQRPVPSTSRSPPTPPRTATSGGQPPLSIEEKRGAVKQKLWDFANSCDDANIELVYSRLFR